MHGLPPRTGSARGNSLFARTRISWVYLVCAVGFVAALFLLLGQSAYSEYLLTVCIGFSVIFFGLVTVNLWIVRRSREEVPPFDVEEPSDGVFRTFTGTLRKADAKLQLMIIPVAVAFGFLALTAVELWDRARLG